MMSKDTTGHYESSLEKRVKNDLWKRIEKASTLGESILQAQQHRGVGQILTADQIRALASATGVIKDYQPITSINKTAFFPMGNLPEETLHELSDAWRDSPVMFARTVPSAYINSARLEQMGIEKTPDYYQRDADMMSS